MRDDDGLAGLNSTQLGRVNARLKQRLGNEEIRQARRERDAVQDHSEFQHPTRHNLTPVNGASAIHGGTGTPEEHAAYADYHAKKADWHYKRWGNPRQPQATLAKAGVHDFKSRIAKGWPK